MKEELFYQMDQLEDCHWWFVGRKLIIEQIIRKSIKQGVAPAILDVGCGTGGMLKMLNKYGEVVGYEPNRVAARMAQTKDFVIYQDNQNILQDKQTYDLVTCFDVLEHVNNEREFINEISLYTKKDGYLLITAPALNILWSDHDVIHHHFKRYTKRTLKQLFPKNRYKIEYCSYFNFFLFPVVLVIRLIHKILHKKGSNMNSEPKLVNYILRKIFISERIFMKNKISLPFGVSLVILVKKLT